MRRFLSSIMLFCLLCGGGLMLLGSKFGAERTIEAVTADGRRISVSLFDGKGFAVNWGSSQVQVEAPGVRVDIPTLPEVPEAPELPEGGVAGVVDLSGESISRLNVYAAMGEVTVQRGEGWSVSLDGIDSFYEANDGYLDVSAGMGNVVVTVPRDITLEYLSIESDTGSITLDGIQIASMELDQSFGDTVLKNCSWTYADIDNDCGSIMGTGLASAGLDASVDMGEVDLEGDFTGETDIEASMGSVKLTLSGKQSDYDIDLDADLGNITLNGRSCGKAVSQNGGPYELDVSCSLGGIEVRFNQ